jgi:catechol 2,3-dioxygenase-like lactoylglutathione lyase family enzyme
VTGFEACIAVADLAASKRFYSALGFQVVDDTIPGVVVMAFQEFRIGLYAKSVVKPLLVFRGGNVKRIADRAKSQGLVFEAEPATSDGTTTAMLRDPDGNAVSFVSRA